MLNRIFDLYGKNGRLLHMYRLSVDTASYHVVCIVRYPASRHLVIHITAKNHILRERIEEWAMIAEHYLNTGIYSPQYIRNLFGTLVESVDGYEVWSEEYTKYHTLSYERRDITEDELYRNCEKSLFESVGKIASAPAVPVSFSTAFCLYDPYSKDENTDENEECARELRDYYCTHFPFLASEVSELYRAYEQKKRSLEQQYRALPKAVFQGNLSHDNILITPKGSFRGVRDFRFSGTETVLNYAFCESYASISADADVSTLLDRRAMYLRDRKTIQRLSWIGNYYHFTESEHRVFSDYYNIVAPFRWPYYVAFMKWMQAKDGEKNAASILQWMRYQFTRRDIESFLPRSRIDYKP